MKKKIYTMPSIGMTEIILTTAIMSGDALPAAGNNKGQEGTGGINGIPGRHLYV